MFNSLRSPVWMFIVALAVGSAVAQAPEDSGATQELEPRQQALDRLVRDLRQAEREHAEAFQETYRQAQREGTLGRLGAQVDPVHRRFRQQREQVWQRYQQALQRIEQPGEAEQRAARADEPASPDRNEVRVELKNIEEQILAENARYEERQEELEDARANARRAGNIPGLRRATDLAEDERQEHEEALRHLEARRTRLTRQAEQAQTRAQARVQRAQLAEVESQLEAAQQQHEQIMADLEQTREAARQTRRRDLERRTEELLQRERERHEQATQDLRARRDELARRLGEPRGQAPERVQADELIQRLDRLERQIEQAR